MYQKEKNNRENNSNSFDSDFFGLNFHIVNMRNDSIQNLKYVGHATGFDFHEGMDKLYFGVFQYNFSGIY